MKRYIVLLLVGVLVAGCGLFDKKKPPLPGVRISVLGLDRQLEPDPKLAATPVVLPAPVVNADWPQAGGDPDHAMHRVALPATLRQVWSASVGDGSGDYHHVMAPPIVAGGRVYAMDGGSQLSALAASACGRSS
jgi:outer membrane protein assembly factor BamB